ncbi:MAG: MmcQ/YjbR family DNA-binding protein [Dehalococcoidia bacterium]
MQEALLDRLRGICLALPEATERETWGEATFRVREKIFAMAGGESSLALSCKAPAGAQEMLIEANPARFFKPAYVGPKGWIGVRFDDETDWEEVAFLVRQSYEMTAPKKLVKEWSSRAAQATE